MQFSRILGSQRRRQDSIFIPTIFFHPSFKLITKFPRTPLSVHRSPLKKTLSLSHNLKKVKLYKTGIALLLVCMNLPSKSSTAANKQ